MPKGRFFQRVSDGKWLARVDTGSSLSTAEAVLHCAAEYGVPVKAVEADLPEADFAVLKAQRQAGAIIPPAQPPPPLTAEQQAFAAATTDAQRLGMVAKKLYLVP